MSHSQDLKKQLLRQAVEDNVSTIEGRPLAREVAHSPRDEGDAATAPKRGGRAWWTAAAVLLLSAAGIFSAIGPAQNTTSPLPTESLGEIPSSLPAPKPEPEADPDQTFAAPRPIEADVFPLEVKRLVIDPGHGGEDLGTVEGELNEKDLTLDIAMRLKKRLEEASYEVLMTRQTDRAISLRERAQFANAQRADAFISIHINWISVRRVRGIETYFLGPTEDPELAALARRENRQSGYSLADLKSLLEGIYADVRQDESRRLATRVQSSLFRSLRSVNPELQDRGVKTAPFVVLVATDMPAILAEVSCLSNQDEAELLSRPLYREHIAEALFRGVQGFVQDVNQIEEKGS